MPKHYAAGGTTKARAALQLARAATISAPHVTETAIEWDTNNGSEGDAPDHSLSVNPSRITFGASHVGERWLFAARVGSPTHSADPNWTERILFRHYNAAGVEYTPNVFQLGSRHKSDQGSSTNSAHREDAVIVPQADGDYVVVLVYQHLTFETLSYTVDSHLMVERLAP